MAALVEGHEYGLSSRIAASGSKTVIHFKLTDSSLKAIEEFAKIKDGTARRPSLQFLGTQGRIEIPAKKSSDDVHGMRVFRFTLSAPQGDLNGSFDCIKQSNPRSGQAMDMLGAMSHKVVVHATDDVYKATKERMTQAEEESKKVCTKVIKASGPYIGHKVKKVIKDGSFHKHQSAAGKLGAHSHGHKTHGVNGHNNSSSHSPISAIVARTFKPLSSNQNNLSSSQGAGSSHTMKNLSQSHHHSRSSLSNSSGSHSRTSSQPAGTTSSTILQPSVTNSGNSANVMGPASLSKPNSHSTSSASSSPAVQRSNHSPSPVMNYPYRDRVIHLLAVRPYKKPEIFLRLNKDGVREKDKKSLSSVLQQVATFSAKDNSFTLAKHAFNDVKVDWPFYSEADRLMVKRKLSDLRSSSVSPASSPANSNPESPSMSQKRPGEQYTDPQPSKKQRISHYIKKENKEVYPSSQPEKQSPTSTTSPESSLAINAKVDEVNSKNLAHSTSEMPEYYLQYKHIGDKEQRQTYKQDFNREYQEYMILHSNIDKVTKKFTSLEKRMKETKEGTDDYENLKNVILKEYKTRKSDPKYLEQKKRFEYLHKKLGHIKQLIVEYDNSQTAAS